MAWNLGSNRELKKDHGEGKEHHKNVYLRFIDHSMAVDSVEYLKL